MNEYTNVAVGNGCAYRTLNNYNQMGKGTSPPVPPTTVIGKYIVPMYGAPGYNTLTHGLKGPSCSGFFNIVDAYGKGAENCSTQYATRLCQ